MGKTKRGIVEKLIHEKLKQVATAKVSSPLLLELLPLYAPSIHTKQSRSDLVYEVQPSRTKAISLRLGSDLGGRNVSKCYFPSEGSTPRVSAFQWRHLPRSPSALSIRRGDAYLDDVQTSQAKPMPSSWRMLFPNVHVVDSTWVSVNDDQIKL